MRALRLPWWASMMAASVVVAAGCRERAAPPAATGPVAGDAAPPSDNARLDELVSRYLDDTTAASPALATWLGLHGADDKLDDVSAASEIREMQRLRRTLERLESLPVTHLDAEHALDRELLERDLRLSLFRLGELRVLERSPIVYVDLFSSGIDELLAREFAPLPERLHDVNGRLAHARTLFDEARKNLKNPPELYTRRAIELAQSARGFLMETLPRVEGAPGDERLLADFRTVQGEALRSLDDYLGFLQRDLLPRSKGDLALGKAKLIEELRVREQLSLYDLTPDALLGQLLAAGDRELKAADKRFEEAARLVAPNKSPPDAFRQLEDDHPGADELLPVTAALVNDVLEFARDHRLLSLPSQPPRVVEMPPYLWGFARMSLPGPFEPQPQNDFQVDPVNKAWERKTVDEHLRAFNRAQLSQVVLREALARRAQAEVARRAPTTVQKLTFDEAFTEGWPRYFAQVMLDEGYGTGEGGKPDPRLRLAQRREAMLVLCRYVAALRFHALGARFDDVIDLFKTAGYLDDIVARREAERVAVDPDVLDEGLGLLMLEKLREDVERDRGDRFSLGAFHDELLAHGALPLGLLRKRFLPGDRGPLL